VLRRVCDGTGTPRDLEVLLEVGASISPGDFPHAAVPERGLEAKPFPYQMTTICFVGPSAFAPLHSAMTLFPEEFEARVAPNAHLEIGPSHGSASSTGLLGSPASGSVSEVSVRV